MLASLTLEQARLMSFILMWRVEEIVHADLALMIELYIL
jgi:hypothetical protein